MTGSIRILHVDDEPDFADMTARFLERADDQLEVVTETSAVAGLERLQDVNVDCIVSDYQMPGMDGLEFLKQVRENRPDLPFILFTGRGSEEVASEAITAGASDYLQKGDGTEQYELLANRVRNVVDQHRATRRAAELDRLRTLASDINQALVRADSRDEIETQVCEIISDSNPYLFAWIGDIDPDTGKIEPRTSAGIETGYLDEITVTADDSPTGQGPGGTAIRERRIAISQDVANDPEFEPWRDVALDRGFRAAAAIPLEFEDKLYGELVVYADRSRPFDDDERELLVELGDNIAHSLAAIELREELHSETKRYRQLTESARVGIITIDADSDIQFANPTVEDIFGYAPEELVGESLTRLMPTDYRDQHCKALTRFLETDERRLDWSDVEFPGLRKDGQKIDLNLSFSAFERNGEQYFEGIVRDVSERRKREHAIEGLHDATNRLVEAETPEEIAETTVDAVREILQIPANGVHLHDPERGGLAPVAWTDRTEEVVGKPPTFAPGEGLAGIAFETGEPQIYDDISTVPERYNPETIIRSQIVLPLDDHGVLVIGSPESDAFDETEKSLAKTLAGHATAALDRIAQEQELREEREFIEQALDSIDDLFYVIGPDGKAIRWNARVPEITGYENDDIADMDAVEYFPPEERARVAEAIEETIATGHNTIETELLTAYGERLPYEFSGSRLTGPAGDFVGLVGMGRDIADRKDRQRELERRQSLLEAVLETTIDGILVIDENREYVTWNQQFIEMWDVPEELVGEQPEEKALEHAMDQLENPQEFIEKVEYLYENPREESRDEIRLSDGRVFDRYSAPVEADDGTHFGRVWSFRDITQRKRRERELSRQNERLEDFASVVSHDLRNPLYVAEGQLKLAGEECEGDHLDSAANAVERSLNLIEDVLALAREGKQAREFEPVDLAKMSEQCWENVQTAQATLVTESSGTIQADPGQLKQLLENLMRNAVEHGGESVTVTVGNLAHGFSVSDDGPGIPEEERELVFDPGYSTTSGGTGFGLKIVQEVAEAHDWAVHVTESEDGGARFEFTGVEFDN